MESASTGREVRLNELEHQQPALILDALIGYGLEGPPQGLAADLIRWANDSGSRILSLDVPSGMESTMGETPGEFVGASMTLTLALPKTGLVPEKTGELLLADIGIPDRVYSKVGLEYQPIFGCRYYVPLEPAEPC